MIRTTLHPWAAILPIDLLCRNPPSPPVPEVRFLNALTSSVAKRIAIDLLSRVPMRDRQASSLSGEQLHVSTSLRELHEILWPLSGKSWRARGGRTAATILAALRECEVHNANLNGPDDTFPIAYDPIRGNGPLIDLRPLRRLPLHCQAMYDAAIRLAYLCDTRCKWDKRPVMCRVDGKPDGQLIGADGEFLWSDNGKGRRPAISNLDPRAVPTGEYETNPRIDRLPWLNATQLVALVYGRQPPAGPQYKRNQSARNILARMIEAGLVSAEFNGRKRGGWRVRIAMRHPDFVPTGGSTVPTGVSAVPKRVSNPTQVIDSEGISGITQYTQPLSGMSVWWDACASGLDADTQSPTDRDNPAAPQEGP